MGIKDNVLFVRGEQDEDLDSSDDLWDDSVLIKAYERAINLAKEKISLKTSEDSDQEIPQMKEETVKESKKGHKNQKNTAIPWKVGSYCRAIYSSDRQEYEATVMKILPKKGKCTVRYLGYNNEEDVELKSLKPSRGERVRNCQIIESKNEDAIEESSSSKEDHAPESGYTDNKKFGFPSMIPPPPPVGLMGNFPTDEGEAFSSMLMSWYMSGYHTGYYQGLMKSKAGRSSNSENSRYNSSKDDMSQ